MSQSTSNGSSENPKNVSSSAGVHEFSQELSSVWNSIEKSRHSQRPHTLDYISSLFFDFEEIKGDRCFADDAALVAGIGELKNSISDSKNEKQTVFFLGHQKGRNTKQKIARNFGMAKPEGYRKALRVFEMAERFKKPLLTFIDTPGAYPGVGAEERGQSEAIAKSIQRMFEMKSPSIGFVIGEGGSGGALAIGVVDKLFMLEHATYSVISPESCAAILWGTATESKRAAWALKMNAENTLKLGICDGIIKEPGEGAQEDFEKTCSQMRELIFSNLSKMSQLTPEIHLQNRFLKYRNIDSKAYESNS